PLPAKRARCLDRRGAYHVAGLGPAFWSAAAQALDPDRHPSWTAATLAGARRLGLAPRSANGPDAVYADFLDAARRIRSEAPALTAQHVDDFLTLVARMRGRDLFRGADDADPLPALIR